MADGPLHSVSVAGVTFDEAGRVLLIKRRDNGQWQAPGGILEVDEKFEDGVVREVAEETGVSVLVEYLTGVYKNVPKGVVALVYRCRVVDGSATETAESVEVAWLEVPDALTRMAPAFAIRVSDAQNAQSSVVASRSHDGVNLL